MLRKIGPVRQIPGEPERCWYESRNCDLIVWLADDYSPMGFQFCYGKEWREHALTWLPERGFTHLRIDSGDYGPSVSKATPLLVASGAFCARSIRTTFLAESGDMRRDWREFIVRKLDELAAVEGGSVE